MSVIKLSLIVCLVDRLSRVVDFNENEDVSVHYFLEKVVN